MATKEEIQELVNRGLQDQLPPEKKAALDELINRGVISTPQGQSVNTEDAPSFLEQADSDLQNFTREVLNTGTFGLSDIVGGLGSAAASELFGEDGGEAFNQPREERREFREENPTASFIASMLGGFINPLAPKAAGFIGGAATQTAKPGLAGIAGRSSLTGAGFAGAQSTGEEIGQTIGQAVTGQEIDPAASLERIGVSTGTGAAIGGVIPPAVAGISKGFSGVANLLTRFSDKAQGTRALRKVAEAMQRDGLSPSQALERLDKLGPEAALVDLGDNSRALGFTVGGIPGKGKTDIIKFLRNRQEGVRNPVTGRIEGGQVNRIQDHIDDLIQSNFFTERQTLANINNSAKLYDSAYSANQNVESKVIDRILKTPSGRRAFTSARKTLQDLRSNLSKVDPELTAQLKETGGEATGRGVGRGLKLEFLDQVKRELFDLEEAAKTNFGRATSKSRAITKLRRDLIDEMDKVDATGGDFARARLLAGDKLANQEALEKGANFLSESQFSTPEELGVVISEMSPEARHLFRVGAAQSLKGKLAKVVTRADATKKLIDIQGLERKIDLAFGDRKKFVAYTEFLESEKELFRAVTDVLGNSKTAERGAALADESIDPGRVAQGIRDFLGGRFTQATANLLVGAKERVTVPPSQSEALANILTGRSVQGLTPSPSSQITQGGGPRSIQEAVARALSQSTGPRIAEGTIPRLQGAPNIEIAP